MMSLYLKQSNTYDLKKRKKEKKKKKLPLTHLNPILNKTLNSLKIENRNQKGALLLHAQPLDRLGISLLRLKSGKSPFSSSPLQIIIDNYPKPIRH